MPPLTFGIVIYYLASARVTWRLASRVQSITRMRRKGFRDQSQATGLVPVVVDRLAVGDVADFARTLSCHQDIAAEGAFSLGMLARFEPVLREQGAAAYRELFWEAGLIGQALYLAAEAAGVRGTGIGCYFDDVLHRVLGLTGSGWQSLYHFTIGVPVEDLRLRTAPPYQHRVGDVLGKTSTSERMTLRTLLIMLRMGSLAFVIAKRV